MIGIRIILVIVFLISLTNDGFGQQSTPANDKWIAWDKAKHLLVSATLMGFGYHIFKYDFKKSHQSSIYFGLSLSLSAGLTKEYINSKRGGKASYKDIVADLMGIGIALLVIRGT